MGPPTISVVFIVALGLTVTLPEPAMAQVQANSAAGEDKLTTTNMTREGQDQCSPLQRRQDLLENRMIEVDKRMTERDTRLTERDSDLNRRLNGLNTWQNEADSRLNSRLNGMDARLNRIDGRFDDLETAMSDMKDYLRQQLDAMELVVERALTGTKQPEEVGSTTTPTTWPPQVPKDCKEAYAMGLTSSGVYRIAPEPNTHIDVYCEQELSGGGWIVFQVRKDGSVDFYKDWSAYKQGFGELNGEFWFGNTNLHLLTKGGDQVLKVELTSPGGEVLFADYSHFSIGPETDDFRLSVSGYTGGAPPGDSMSYSNGQKFSTSDRDNDGYSGSCTTARHGAWWYRKCTYSNLNGSYGGAGLTGVYWFKWTNSVRSLKASRMMVRRKT